MDLFQLLSSPDVNWWTGVLWITCGLFIIYYLAGFNWSLADFCIESAGFTLFLVVFFPFAMLNQH